MKTWKKIYRVPGIDEKESLFLIYSKVIGRGKEIKESWKALI